MYQVFSLPPGQPRNVLGYFSGNTAGDAIAAATVELNLPPNAPHIRAWLVETRHLVEQQAFTSIKLAPTAHQNEGALSRNANTEFVNCREFLGQQGHNELHNRMVIDGMSPNTNGGCVMGVGGGVSYVGYRNFATRQKAEDYLQSLGFNLKFYDRALNLINTLNLPQNNAGAFPAHNQAPLVQALRPKINYSIPDLTIHPPRSVRVRIGGYAHLARLLDKARAVIHGKNAGYHYDCAVDKLLFAFTGVTAEAMLAEIKRGKSDLEILTWLNANTKRQAFEVIAWSAWLEQVGSGSAEGHEGIAGVIKVNNSARDDIRSLVEMLDLDDYVSYGGGA